LFFEAFSAFDHRECAFLGYNFAYCFL